MVNLSDLAWASRFSTAVILAGLAELPNASPLAQG
jgi:hypothetical protein